jgi:hypothetical protein
MRVSLDKNKKSNHRIRRNNIINKLQKFMKVTQGKTGLHYLTLFTMGI